MRSGGILLLCRYRCDRLRAPASAVIIEGTSFDLERCSMITGSCLCGGVRYEVDGRIGPALNCHCSMCRKVTGAAFRSRVAVPRKNFRWVAGEDLLTLYASSPTTTRTFCKICGSTLVSLFHDNPETLGLPMGTLDDDPGIRPTFHVFVGSKASWFEISDGLPQFEGFPPRSLVRQDGSETSIPGDG